MSDPYSMRFWLLGMTAFGSLWIEKAMLYQT